MMDTSFSEQQHWEDLQEDDSAKNGLDQSFHTVHSHSDHPEAGDFAIASTGTSVDLPKELLCENISVSGTVSTATSRSGQPTVTTYEDVVYHEEVGTLILNSHRITFQPHEDHSDHEEDTKNYQNNSNHQSWRWKAIRKHQVSPAKVSMFAVFLLILKYFSDPFWRFSIHYLFIIIFRAEKSC
jgi:hypothetical protein